jgi:hypothetical protein
MRWRYLHLLDNVLLSLYFQGGAFPQINSPWQRVEGLADINTSFTNTQSSILPVNILHAFALELFHT